MFILLVLQLSVQYTTFIYNHNSNRFEENVDDSTLQTKPCKVELFLKCKADIFQHNFEHFLHECENIYRMKIKLD